MLSRLEGIGLKHSVVTLEPRRVAYTVSVGDPSTSDAFARLEAIVPLKDNRFYATFDAGTKEYRACVALKDGETAGKKYGLPEMTLPGGKYATAKLTGSLTDIVQKIAPSFRQLREEHTRDPARLPIEFYKRHTEVILYLPIGPRS